MKIEHTPRGGPKDLGANMNVTPDIVTMKRVEVLPDAPGKTKRSKTHGRERWEVEFDGLGNVEVNVEIPASIHHLKDQAKRTRLVRARVAKAAQAEGDARLAAHS